MSSLSSSWYAHHTGFPPCASCVTLSEFIIIVYLPVSSYKNMHKEINRPLWGVNEITHINSLESHLTHGKCLENASRYLHSNFLPKSHQKGKKKTTHLNYKSSHSNSRDLITGKYLFCSVKSVVLFIIIVYNT